MLLTNNFLLTDMKKTVLLLIVGTVFSLSACKSSQNAYKQAYEKAVSGDEVKTTIEEPVAVNDATDADDVSNVSVREEKVTLVSGDKEIKTYGIVCGSFSLRERLIKDGYQAVVVVNEAGKTYRVVCASFDTKEEAVTERNKFKAKYPDNQDFQGAWILYKK